MSKFRFVWSICGMTEIEAAGQAEAHRKFDKMDCNELWENAITQEFSLEKLIDMARSRTIEWPHGPDCNCSDCHPE